MNTKISKKSLSALIVVMCAVLVVGVVKAATGANTLVQVSIATGNINIYSTGTFNFGQYTVSASNQTVTGAFLSYFSVEDLKGLNSGYYTTVQMSGNLMSPGGASIANTGISMLTLTTGTTLIAGTANLRVQVAAGMLSFSSLDTARTLIKRDNAANLGVLGQYGTLPQMQVLIPAFQTIGVYTGTLVYTLYEN